MEKSEKYLLESASIVSNDPTILDHLGDLYSKLGSSKRRVITGRKPSASAKNPMNCGKYSEN